MRALPVLALLWCTGHLACVRYVGDQPAPHGDAQQDAGLDAARVDAIPSDAAMADRASHDAAADTGADAAPDSGPDPLRPFGTPQLVPISSSASEDDPTLTGDMLEIYFNRAGDIWYATRASLSGDWSVPVVATTLSSTAGETNPELTGDGLTIYFASDRSHAQASGTHDIYRSTRPTRSTPWSAPAPVVPLNTSAEEHPGVSSDDRIMIITSSRPGMLGEYDFFQTSRAATSQPWGPVTWLDNVSTTALEVSPWIDASGTVLFFSSNRGGLPQVQIWAAVRSGPSQAFPSPQLVTSLSPGDKNEDPWLSPDLKTVYFASRPAGQTGMDIYTAAR